MPFTPLHFGPHILVSLPFPKRIDMVSFVTANIAVDVEPLLVLLFFRFKYPLHGYCHTFLFGTLVGVIWGAICYASRRLIRRGLIPFRLIYKTTAARAIVSGILGAWAHVLLDAPLYSDIKPFFPSDANPLYQTLSQDVIYGFGSLTFLLAMVIYWRHYSNTPTS